jgi:hypothetical protein
VISVGIFSELHSQEVYRRKVSLLMEYDSVKLLFGTVEVETGTSSTAYALVTNGYVLSLLILICKTTLVCSDQGYCPW